MGNHGKGSERREHVFSVQQVTGAPLERELVGTGEVNCFGGPKWCARGTARSAMATVIHRGHDRVATHHGESEGLAMEAAAAAARVRWGTQARTALAAFLA